MLDGTGKPNGLYLASGGSRDWAYAEAGMPYSYSLELRDTGEGFITLPEHIIPIAEETWAFHQTAARMIIDEFHHGNYNCP